MPEKVTITSADVAEVPAEIVRPAKSPRADALRRELEAERDMLQAVLDGNRAIYDRLINDPELLIARRCIKETSAKLAPILNELAALARAGGAKSIKAEAGEYTSSNV